MKGFVDDLEALTEARDLRRRRSRTIGWPQRATAEKRFDVISSPHLTGF